MLEWSLLLSVLVLIKQPEKYHRRRMHFHKSINRFPPAAPTMKRIVSTSTKGNQQKAPHKTCILIHSAFNEMAEGMFFKIKGQSICELKRHWPNNPQEIPYLLIQVERYKKKKKLFCSLSDSWVRWLIPLLFLCTKYQASSTYQLACVVKTRGNG